ncbi:uncharacterized protein Dana_GF26551, isoform C [Drosophila ananassae]|uniref:Uncharacterized protein, isoform C n=1 Tax=Drosophila ananassae TaxID=7217 RepID=A0A0P8Y0A2_DROAN|nr:uncharacterized protein LOC26513960 isoform X2 [Drosophila ananassae]KPU80626.1 uncharacterized protein Dana_GF26551, isoform C [Drosophila ananassae]
MTDEDSCRYGKKEQIFQEKEIFKVVSRVAKIQHFINDGPLRKPGTPTNRNPLGAEKQSQFLAKRAKLSKLFGVTMAAVKAAHPGHKWDIQDARETLCQLTVTCV